MERDVYTKCYHNGKKHIDLAIKLGTEKEFGVAITHLVIGIEELIKFLVIQLSFGPEQRFNKQELDKLFSSHGEKHKLIIEFLKATKPGFEEQFVLAIFNKMRDLPLTKDLQEADTNRFKEIGSMTGLTTTDLSASEIDSFIEWLSKYANAYKNKGLYVDLEDRSKTLIDSNLISPADVQEHDYQLALKFVNSFLKQVTFSKDIDLTDEELVSFFCSEFDNGLEIKIKKPSDCSATELTDFKKLVITGGQVLPTGLEQRIKACKFLGFCSINNELAGISAIKKKDEESVLKIRKKAAITGGTPPHLELGYSVTLEKFRKRGINGKLNDALLELISEEKIYATTAIETMRKYLLSKDFKKIGQSFKGTFNDTLDYFER